MAKPPFNRPTSLVDIPKIGLVRTGVVADLFAVSPDTLKNWQKSHGFPDIKDRTKPVVLWRRDWAEIRAWAAKYLAS